MVGISKKPWFGSLPSNKEGGKKGKGQEGTTPHPNRDLLLLPSPRVAGAEEKPGESKCKNKLCVQFGGDGGGEFGQTSKEDF